MARKKRTTRREKGSGTYWYDAKTQRHCWRLQFRGKPYDVADRDEARAKARFEDLKRMVLNGTDIEGGRQVLNVYLPRYIATEVARQHKQSTAHDYQKRADYFILPTLGEYRLCDLKRRVVVAWVNAMLDYRSEAGKVWALNSIRQALRLLQRCLDTAVAEGYLEDNPAASVKVPRRRAGDETKIDDDAGEDKARALTPAHEALFMDDVRRTEKYHRLTLLYTLALRLGLRRGELLGLRWKDIDLDEEKVLRVRQHVVRLDSKRLITTPKTPSSRRDVPLSDDLVAQLRAHKLSLGAEGRVLIFPSKNGEVRPPDSISQHFRRVCDRLGLKGYTLHSLRKTAITNWRRNGVDEEVTIALAGHKTFKVTAEHYSDAQMDRKRAAIERTRNAE